MVMRVRQAVPAGSAANTIGGISGAVCHRLCSAPQDSLSRMNDMATPWSETVQDYYPISPRPRWGYENPPHAAIQRVLEGQRVNFEAALTDLGRHRDALYAVSYAYDPAGLTPRWDNVWFSCLDAASLIGFLLTRRPQRYIEIGSGHSTLFARHAVRWGELKTTITSIDPQPRADIDSICDEMVRCPLEDCAPEFFDALMPADILFFDGSHRVFTNSDTTTLFFDILPRLRPGVLVHLHDIFLPSDYPAVWNGRLYSEQYLLGAQLLCGAPPFKVVLPSYFVCMDENLGAQVRTLFDGRPDMPIPFTYNNGANIPGVSFWLETT
jgi:Methyltransferase domain